MTTEEIKLGIIIIAFFVFVIFYLPNHLKKQLTPLLSLIDGRVYLKFQGFMLTVLEGLWQGVKVKIGLKHLRWNTSLFIRHTNLFITFFSPCPCPFSFKVRPTSSLLGLVNRDVGALADGHRLQIPEAGITVYCPAGDETRIREVLTPARLAIIKKIFSYKFNYFEVHTDTIAGDYIKIGIKDRSYALSIEACKTAILPKVMSYILKLLKEFPNPDENNAEVKHTVLMASGIIRRGDI